MGTHPIFESDFDCLTEGKYGLFYVLGEEKEKTMEIESEQTTNEKCLNFLESAAEQRQKLSESLEVEFEKLIIAEGYDVTGGGDSSSLKENEERMVTRSQTKIKKPSEKIGVKRTVKPNRAQLLRNAEMEKRKSLSVRSSQSMAESLDATSVSITSSIDRKSSAPIKSKIGSLNNVKHRPGGGSFKIESKRMSFAGVGSKIGSMDKVQHKPGGGNVKIQTQKIKIESKSKVGSLNNVNHRPGGGKVKIETQKLRIESKSKIGSMDNVKHKPQGGNVKIHNRRMSVTPKSKIGSLANVRHTPGGGDFRVENQKLDLSKVTSKCGTLDKVGHKAAGGDVEIFDEKMEFDVKSKCGTLDNVSHKAGGGDVVIFNEKNLPWKEGDAEGARTIDSGSGSIQGSH